MAYPSQPDSPRAKGPARSSSSPPQYAKVGPPVWLLAVAGLAVVASVALLAMRSFGASLAGLAVTAVVLAIISAFRFLVIRGEANPEFVALPWQIRTASALLVVNFIVSIGHAYVIALEVGKQWG